MNEFSPFYPCGVGTAVRVHSERASSALCSRGAQTQLERQATGTTKGKHKSCPENHVPGCLSRLNSRPPSWKSNPGRDTPFPPRLLKDREGGSSPLSLGFLQVEKGRSGVRGGPRFHPDSLPKEKALGEPASGNGTAALLSPHGEEGSFSERCSEDSPRNRWLSPQPQKRAEVKCTGWWH